MSNLGELLQIQDYFTEVQKETTTKLTMWITKCKYSNDEQRFLAEEICFISLIRPQSLDLLTTVVFNMMSSENFKYFRTALIDELLEKKRLIFLRKLLVSGALVFSEIEEKVVGDDRLIFAPEFSLFDDYTEFEEHSEFGFPIDSLGFAIKYDNEKSMMDIVKGNFDMNVEFCPFEATKKPFDLMTPLATAALFGSKRCFEELIKNGAKIDSKVVDCAVAGGNMNIISQLGDVKFNIDIALKYRRGQVLNNCFDFSFVQCIRNRHYAAAVMCFDGEPNKKDEFGFTPLHYAVKQNCVAFVNFLVSNDCDVNVLTQGNGSETALHIAVRQRNMSIAKLLLDNGAEEKQDANGDTPLHFAVRQNEVEMCKLLMSKGANPMTKNLKGVSPLSIAKDNRNFELFGLLSIDQ